MNLVIKPSAICSLLLSMVCGCRAVDYRRGELQIPIPHVSSTIDTNHSANYDRESGADSFPGSARSLSKVENWFKDADGRYVLFRGVNIGTQSKKRPFYLPLRLNVPGDFDDELKRVSPCLDALPRLGFNIVRLSVIWKGLEPMPDKGLSEAYVEALGKFVDALYRRDLFVIVEFHQDIASDWYGGDGFPDWALAVDDEHPLPESPPASSPHWFLRYEDVWWPASLWLDPRWPWEPELSGLVRNTERSFWSNRCDNVLWKLKDYPTQSAFIHAVGNLAAAWKTNPAVIGYELFNEPNDVGFDRAVFEKKYLTPFYCNASREIRQSAQDTNSFVFVEPRTDWNYLATNASESGLSFLTDGKQIHCFLGEDDPESFLYPEGTNNSEKAVFAFHFYDSWTSLWAGFGLGDNMANKQREWPGIFQAMVRGGTDRNLIPFMTEFGAQNSWRRFSTRSETGDHDTEDRAYLDLGLRQVEANLLNTTLWDYNFYADDPEKGGDQWNGEAFSLLAQSGKNSWAVRNADIIARPYPMRSSAKPELLYFDLKSKHAAIILSGKPVAAATVIYVPRDIQYTNEFEVMATSSEIQWDKDKELLYWKPNSAFATNQIVIFPSGDFQPESLPAKSRALLGATTNHAAWMRGLP
jgi:aryl-phospho-beta-D-glucosidase BglC (GH1 family)